LDEVQAGLGEVGLPPGPAEADGGPRLADAAAGRAGLATVPDGLTEPRLVSEQLRQRRRHASWLAQGGDVGVDPEDDVLPTGRQGNQPFLAAQAAVPDDDARQLERP